MHGAAASEVIGQTWGSKDNLGQDNVQLRPDAHLPSNCNNCLWHIQSEERNKRNGVWGDKGKEERKYKTRTSLHVHLSYLSMNWVSCCSGCEVFMWKYHNLVNFTLHYEKQGGKKHRSHSSSLLLLGSIVVTVLCVSGWQLYLCCFYTWQMWYI